MPDKTQTLRNLSTELGIIIDEVLEHRRMTIETFKRRYPNVYAFWAFLKKKNRRGGEKRDKKEKEEIWKDRSTQE